MSEDKEDFRKTMEKELNELGKKIDELLGNAERKARTEYERLSRELPPKMRDAREKLDELQYRGGEAWKELKPGLEKAWGELKTAVDNAATRFRESKSSK